MGKQRRRDDKDHGDDRTLPRSISLRLPVQSEVEIEESPAKDQCERGNGDGQYEAVIELIEDGQNEEDESYHKKAKS